MQESYDTTCRRYCLKTPIFLVLNSTTCKNFPHDNHSTLLVTTDNKNSDTYCHFSNGEYFHKCARLVVGDERAVMVELNTANNFCQLKYVQLKKICRSERNFSMFKDTHICSHEYILEILANGYFDFNKNKSIFHDFNECHFLKVI